MRLPEDINNLAISIFWHGSGGAKSREWESRVKKAATGNLSLVWPRFAVWLLDVELKKSRAPVIRLVLGLHKRAIDGGTVSNSEWDAARRKCKNAIDRVTGCNSKTFAFALVAFGLCGPTAHYNTPTYACTASVWAAGEVPNSTEAIPIEKAFHQRMVDKFLELLSTP